MNARPEMKVGDPVGFRFEKNSATPTTNDIEPGSNAMLFHELNMFIL